MTYVYDAICKSVGIMCIWDGVGFLGFLMKTLSTSLVKVFLLDLCCEKSQHEELKELGRWDNSGSDRRLQLGSFLKGPPGLCTEESLYNASLTGSQASRAQKNQRIKVH